ncbi:hypothetical protein HDA30_000217 [Micrococcus cohnii]|uniref:Uncharacterized protein n=1 Tax=Micrococcus cohnii TaxID=993416 RepID=A0A7W7GM92_9MICC|nr:hypothetical protein [Micrococcus cohnii]MBB4734709.1 hypothetical protein [Micrococcus cohnii]
MRQNIDREKTVTGYVATAPETVNTQRGQMVAFRLAEPQEGQVPGSGVTVFEA